MVSILYANLISCLVSFVLKCFCGDNRTAVLSKTLFTRREGNPGGRVILAIGLL